MATDWNIPYKGRIIHSYLEVDINDRPNVFGDVPKYFWWLRHNPTQHNTGTDTFNFANYLPSPNAVTEQMRRKKLQATEKVLEEVKKDAEPYLPHLSGHLQSTAHIDAGSSTLSYDAYYAKYAFDPETPYGEPKNYNKTVHAEAMGYPVEYAINKAGNKYINIYMNEVLKP